MNKKNKKEILKKIFILSFVFVIIFVFFKVFASGFSTWVYRPLLSNPFTFGNNTPEPLYVSNDDQTKDGAMITNGLTVAENTEFNLSDGDALLINVFLDGTEAVAGDVLKYNDADEAYGNAIWGQAPTVENTFHSDSWKRFKFTSSLSQYSNYNNKYIVRLTNLGDAIELRTDSVIYSGAGPSIYKFIHTTGLNNFFAGAYAGNNNTGQNNTGVGNSVLINNTKNENTAMGYESMKGNTNGEQNTSAGYKSLFNNTEGNNNTAIGSKALYSNINGNYNTAIGFEALYSNISGSNNTAIGYQALKNNETGHFNIAIGNLSGPDLSNLNDTIAIGKGARPNVNGSAVFGNSDMSGWGFGKAPNTNSEAMVIYRGINNSTSLSKPSGQWVPPSDRNKKHNIKDLSYGLDKILSLRPVSFDWNGSNESDIGLIAQEVKEVLPGIVHGKEGEMGIAYTKLTPVIIQGVKDQNKIIEDDKIRIENFEKELEKLESNLKLKYE